MIKIKLHRYKLNLKGRFGEFALYDDDKLVYKCNSLEEIAVGTKAGCDLAIPVGVYECDLHHSNTKSNGIIQGKYAKKLIRISNDLIAKDRYILIHIGNTLKDTLGCILLGVVDKEYTGVWYSTQTCKEFYTAFYKLYEKNVGKLTHQGQFLCELEITSEIEDELVCLS